MVIIASAFQRPGRGDYDIMSAAQKGLQILPLTEIPMVVADDDLVALIVDSTRQQGIRFEDDDIVVIAQKIVSKAEDRTVPLVDVQPSDSACELAREVNKDARLVELILRESTAVVRTAPGIVIVRHKLGLVCANAGIDQSNVDHGDAQLALLLPEDPDNSARKLRAGLEASSGRSLGVIICDSINRPWRLGTVGVAIGCDGVKVLDDRRGQGDIFGRTLETTMSNVADSVATAASLVMGETTEKVPCVIVRGVTAGSSGETAADCNRPVKEDLFLT
jgi:coenzyme F420-0:L-glutamate ligase/coenzyme F420-1:gamma-L-glutamate ligase